MASGFPSWPWMPWVVDWECGNHVVDELRNGERCRFGVRICFLLMRHHSNH